MTKIKLSPKQKEVIRLMREGWELRQFHLFRNAHWLQGPNCEGAGESKSITDKTVMALHSRKILCESKCDTQLLIFTLTPLGQSINIE